MIQSSVKNNLTVPVGAGVLRRRLFRDGTGKVFYTREYIFQGSIRVVSQHVPTFQAPTVQGVAVPGYKLQLVRE